MLPQRSLCATALRAYQRPGISGNALLMHSSFATPLWAVCGGSMIRVSAVLNLQHSLRGSSTAVWPRPCACRRTRYQHGRTGRANMCVRYLLCTLIEHADVMAL